jgi:hypothetical protein
VSFGGALEIGALTIGALTTAVGFSTSLGAGAFSTLRWTLVGFAELLTLGGGEGCCEVV